MAGSFLRPAGFRAPILPLAVALLTVLAPGCHDDPRAAASAGAGKVQAYAAPQAAASAEDAPTTTGAATVPEPPAPVPDPTVPFFERTPFVEENLLSDIGIATTTTTTLAPLEPVTYESVRGTNIIGEFSSFTSRGLSRWQRTVPGIQDIRLTSSADGAQQPVLWLPPEGDGDRPLLVILHSWSSTYVQHAGIPYAMWAEENGWAVIAPQFRGRNDDADAVGSELAVQDVVDAIEFGIAQDGVEEHRVFVVGYSGGGMMGLLIAGRHPSLVTAVAAWGPVTDLIGFYGSSRASGRHYAWDIERACGGDPRPEGPAQDECLRRSPATYLDLARDAGVAVYLGHGLRDTIVDPRQSARAYNQLAAPADRFTVEQIDQFGRRTVPEELAGLPPVETYFGAGDPPVLFARQSGPVRLVYFGARHEMVYLATMRWFASDPS
jgi:poly(3-hydroxybutyrate) depolymerase